MVPLSVSVPAVSVSPPVPPIAPPNVPAAVDKVSVLAPSVTVPLVPASETIVSLPEAPEISNVPPESVLTLEFEMLPDPVSARVAPLSISVVPE